ncbi:MAG: hypothetical protein IKU65_00845 [Oscillospiraceae bacterium]|nr:hypothetical protein [Oscillospiraceae bacterium]
MKRICAILLIFAFLFAGCGGSTASDLFAVPEMSGMHKALLDTVESVREEGFDFAEPRSGFNRYPLQIMDIDGDGEEEGVAFLRDVVDSYKTFIYVFENSDSVFSLFDVIEGSEKEIYTVSYSSFLHSSGYEIIVEWGTSADSVHPITVYNLTEDGIRKVLDISANQYSVSDIDGNGSNELVAVSKRDGAFFADVYEHGDGRMEKCGSVPLAGVGGKLIRVISGKATQNKNGVFIERETERGIVTDIVSVSDGGYTNLLPEGDLCFVRATAYDVNNDGIIEIPKVSEEVRDVTDTDRTYIWNAVSEDGALISRVFTYHSFSDNWYVSLPLSWGGTVSTEKRATRSAEKEIRFITREGMDLDAQDYVTAHLFSVYVLTGSRRKALAAEEGRFIISEREDVVFAAEIISRSYLSTEITEEFIKAAFKNRESEWTSEILFA